MSAGRSNYYTEVVSRDDYYKDGGEAPGRWLGSGAEALHLTNLEIGYKDTALKSLFSGLNPNDGAVLRHVSLKEREYKIRAKDLESGALRDVTKTSQTKLAWDFTLSAPKSVSVLWSQADGQTRAVIEDCHRGAVSRVATYLEENALFTRTGKGGVSQEQLSPIFAAFTHTTSRATDPQLHDHLLLLNTGLRENGKGGAVDARHLFQHIHTLGSIYRNELRLGLERQLHVQTVDRKVGKEEGFEIKGVPRALCGEFSKRDHEIRQAVREREAKEGRSLSSWEEKAVVLETRSKKGVCSRESLFTAWQEVGREHGFDWRRVIDEKEHRFTKRDAREYIRAVSHTLSYKKEIADQDVFKVSLRHSKGRLPVEQILEFSRSYANEYLTPLSLNKGKPLYALNEKGLVASNPRSPHGEFRSTTNRLVSRVKSWVYRHQSKAYERKCKAFRFRVTMRYALGKIDRATYRRIIDGEGLPTTRAGIQWAYATHQISARQRDFLLSKADPEKIATRELREEKTKRWEEEKKERNTRLTELRDKGLISARTIRDIESGRVRLDSVWRNVERREQAPKGEGIPESKEERRENRDEPTNLRVKELREKGLISEREVKAIQNGSVSLDLVLRDLKRRGKLQTQESQPQDPRQKGMEFQNSRIRELHKKGLVSERTAKDVERGRYSLDILERDLERRGLLEKPHERTENRERYEKEKEERVREEREKEGECEL